MAGDRGFLYTAGSTGLIYLFGVYSSALKRQFGYSQTELDSISTVMFAAGSVTWSSGMLVDVLGPGRGLRIGGAVMAACFLFQYLLVNRRIGLSDSLVLSVLCASVFVQLLSSSTITAFFSTLKATYRPDEQPGFVVGVGKGWVGLFGAIITQVY